MTIKQFMESHGSWNDFAYFDGTLSIGIFPRDGKFICSKDPDEESVIFDTIDDVLDKFIIDSKPFRDILPTLDDNLL